MNAITKLGTDFGLSKRTNITESMGIEIRAEFFNIFKHTQFTNLSNSAGDVNGSQFGQVTSARSSDWSVECEVLLVNIRREQAQGGRNPHSALPASFELDCTNAARETDLWE